MESTVSHSTMKDDLWGVVIESERPFEENKSDEYAMFVVRRDCALSIIVLAMDPSLLYLFDDPNNPVTVWKKLENHLQRKTWCNKLELQCKLHLLYLKDRGKVQEHFKIMTNLF